MTNLDPIVRALREQLPELELLEYEPMRAHCSFRIGGPARALVRPASAEETAAVCRIVRDGGAQPLIIGNGTNLLITDGDVDRIVVQMGERMADVERADATHLRAGAGIPLARLAQAALGYGLAGLEFAHGIPGSLGGAVSMNAGAYGGEMKDVVVSTRYLDHDLTLREAVGAEHDFGYRHSVFSDTDCVVLGSTLALTPGDPEEIRARMMDLSERRRSRQPRHEREFGPRSGGHQDRFQRGSGRPRGHDSHNGLRQDRHGPGERRGQFQKHERHEDHSAQIDVTGLPQVTGTVRAASDRGFGFLESESGSSYFIPPAPMKKLLHGDKIKAAIRTDAQGRTQAVPLELVEPALKRFVARIRIVRNYVNVVPDHPNMHDYMRTKIAPEIKSHEFKEGDWVICELTTHAMNAKNGYHEALIKEFIASADNPRVPWLVTLRGLDLPLASPPDQGEWVINEKFDRTDLTALPFVTIDSAMTSSPTRSMSRSSLSTRTLITCASS